MPRPVWTGAISFGLVSVPVKIYSAARDLSVRFHQFEEGTGARIRYRRVSEQTGEEVPRERILRGYDLGDGRFVSVSDDELDAASPEATRTIDIESFVELDKVDPIYFDTTYYTGPADQTAHRAYGLLYEAMRQSGRVAIGRFVMRSKQRLVALRTLDGLLALETMHFHDEIANAGEVEVPDASGVSERELEMAQQLIDSLTADWDPEAYTDTYRQQILDVIDRKAHGEEIEAAAPPEPAEVIDLVAALRESVERSRAGEESAPARAGAGDGAAPQEGQVPAGEVSDEGDLEGLSRQELYELAQKAGVRGRSEMTKEQLIAALRDRETRRSA